MAAKQHTITAQEVQEIAGVGRGDLVRLVSFTGRATGVTATVSRFTSRGVWVTTKAGAKECWHPSDVRRVRKAAPRG
ncbi:hypothetical protein PP636_gp54 [Arthrobacter phage Hestia]|uniref:Uncharacterized protein n=1 Tax=Arthrobacter phage Hestia TaxID=2419609 RepID=A0A3G3M3D4_9CAUD|nr:hypothetical protein PP636_gp54 [Arthrobacter phage Hestia]AYR00919.1 hypothetical protein PBI_HESTIA_41 [Arthrobacter phage Hestia]